MYNTSFTVRKRENGKYQAIIRQKINGTWKQVESKGGFDKKIQGQQWANKRVAYWQTKIFNDYEKMSVGELKKIYLEDLKVRVKPSSFRTAKSEIAKTILDDKVVTQIKPIEYREFIKSVPYTNNRRMSIFYNFLIEDLQINIRNPFKKSKYKQDKFKRNIEEKEFKEILSLIENESTKLACKIAYYAGLRISEIMSLEITDIKDSSIRVDKQFEGNTYNLTTPKSERGFRVVPISTHLNEEIKTYIKNKKYLNINNRLFDTQTQTQMKHLKNSLDYTEYEGITFHYFRHSYISQLVQGGLDLNTVSYLAGDKLETIVRTYIHETLDTFNIAREFISNNM